MTVNSHSKYHSKKVTVDGITFDSKKEAKRYQELKLLEKAGKIDDLKRQVKFPLIPVQREPDVEGSRGGVKKGKVIERECSYVADFTYNELIATDSDFRPYRYEYVVEDTKGVRTKDYIIKRKLMLWRYGIRIKEI